jgi:hypothetical protein
MGLTFEAIGGNIGKTAACVFFYLQRYGGIMPLRRKRRPYALTFREREEIAKGLAAKLSSGELARRLTRSPLLSAVDGRARYRAIQRHNVRAEMPLTALVCTTVSRSCPSLSAA